MKTGSLMENSLQVVTFRVGNEDYGLHIMRVQEIIRVIEAVKVPKAPAYVEGVINLRGKIIPIIDLRKRMMKAITCYSDASRIIVVDTGGRLAGLVVDTVIDVIMLSGDDVGPCPSLDDSKRSDYIMGVGRQGDRLITVLSLESLLNFV
ncbi:MAG: chemotaxis protein CheW [Nitrospirae bacterium]|nr:chemotaxis protein CheW [Nitrospirota bacterium]